MTIKALPAWLLVDDLVAISVAVNSVVDVDVAVAESAVDFVVLAKLDSDFETDLDTESVLAISRTQHSLLTQGTAAWLPPTPILTTQLAALVTS